MPFVRPQHELTFNLTSNMARTLCVMLCIVTLQACANKNNSRYSIEQDTAPTFDYGQIEYQDIEPRFEPYNVWTSRPYKVLGQYYTPMITGKGHQEEGKASWYGEKFHGHKTANGEIFDMFGLSAAHKTLPLPSFVKVTNLKNNLSTIVRVNDRGPFHDERVLDLSYGAAKKLKFHKYGVAKIKLEVIHINELGDMTVGNQATIFADESKLPLYTAQTNSANVKPTIIKAENPDAATVIQASIEQQASPTAVVDASTPSLFVQVMAMENEEKIKSLAVGLRNLLQVPTATPKVANIYKLHLGPLKNEQKAQNIIQQLSKIGFDEAFAVQVDTQ